ncbi:hypothetical protein ACWEO2_36360 [Nocardia sp. NPDC004278]
MSQPSLDPTVLELLRGSNLAPMLDQPVSHILHQMGLPQLPIIPPAPPLPGLPPLPPLDIGALMRPLTDLAGAFGTGQIGTPAVHDAPAAPAQTPVPAANPEAAPAHNGLPTPNGADAPGTPQDSAAPMPPNGVPGPVAGQAPAIDPMHVLNGITQGLQIVMQLGTTALQIAMQLWQSDGAQSAATKSTAAQVNGGELATQSGGQQAVLGNAAFSMFTGNALMAGVVGQYATTTAMVAPFLVTPPGQAFLLSSTIEAISEGLAVVGKTRAEMAVHSVNMAHVGTKIPITGAPKGLNAQGLQELMQLVQPLAQVAQTGARAAQQLQTANTSLSAPKSIDAAQKDSMSPASFPRGGGVPGGLGGAGVGGGGMPVLGVPATPLSPWTGTSATGAPRIPTQTAAAANLSALEPMSSPVSSGASPGMLPTGGAAGAAASAVRDTGQAAHQANLVTGSNGDAVVGPVVGVTLPVVGAAGKQTAEPPADKEFTL